MPAGAQCVGCRRRRIRHPSSAASRATLGAPAVTTRRGREHSPRKWEPVSRKRMRQLKRLETRPLGSSRSADFQDVALTCSSRAGPGPGSTACQARRPLTLVRRLSSGARAVRRTRRRSVVRSPEIPPSNKRVSARSLRPSRGIDRKRDQRPLRPRPEDLSRAARWQIRGDRDRAGSSAAPRRRRTAKARRKPGPWWIFVIMPVPAMPGRPLGDLLETRSGRGLGLGCRPRRRCRPLRPCRRGADPWRAAPRCA